MLVFCLFCTVDIVQLLSVFSSLFLLVLFRLSCFGFCLCRACLFLIVQCCRYCFGLFACVLVLFCAADVTLLRLCLLRVVCC